jgi:predicted ester cyclase
VLLSAKTGLRKRAIIKEDDMVNITHNKEIVRRFFDLISEGRTSGVEDIVSPDWVNNDPSLPPMRGLDGARQLITLFSTGFPGARVKIINLIAEGDTVAGYFTFDGEHKGKFLDFPPTGKKVSAYGCGLFRIHDGKLIENRVVFDALGLMQQIGVVPIPGVEHETLQSGLTR